MGQKEGRSLRQSYFYSVMNKMTTFTDHFYLVGDLVDKLPDMELRKAWRRRRR